MPLILGMAYVRNVTSPAEGRVPHAGTVLRAATATSTVRDSRALTDLRQYDKIFVGRVRGTFARRKGEYVGYISHADEYGG